MKIAITSLILAIFFSAALPPTAEAQARPANLRYFYDSSAPNRGGPGNRSYDWAKENGFKLIDCKVTPDLCNANRIREYPTFSWQTTEDSGRSQRRFLTRSKIIELLSIIW